MDVENKAIEFIKEHGLSEARIALAYCKAVQKGYVFYKNIGIDVGELKRLIESHELIESCGGLESVGEKLTHGMYESKAVIERLKQAILDVESCQ